MLQPALEAVSQAALHVSCAGPGYDLEESQDVWVGQAVLIAAQHVHHLSEALLTDAELPQTEGYVPPLLAVLLGSNQTDNVKPHVMHCTFCLSSCTCQPGRHISATCNALYFLHCLWVRPCHAGRHRR